MTSGIFESLTGRVFGNWTVRGQAGRGGSHNRILWLCRCACGTEKTLFADTLRNRSRSCGCLTYDGPKVLHGGSKTNLYRIWADMKTRCYNPNHPDYHRYGGRGIVICERWLRSFADFRTDILANIGERPGKGYSINRLNNNGNYELFHPVTGQLQVGWATAKEQQTNTEWCKKPASSVTSDSQGEYAHG